MSLRPIDMTITVQRAPEINRTQTGEHARPEVAHQQVADRINREVQQQDQQVVQTNKSEDGRVDRDGRGNTGDGAGGGRKRKARQDREKDADKQNGKSTGQSLFDVSI